MGCPKRQIWGVVQFFFPPDSGLDWKIPNNNSWHTYSLLLLDFSVLVFFRDSSKYILFRYANTIPILISGRYPPIEFKLNCLVWRILWTKNVVPVYAYNGFRNGSLQNKTCNLFFFLNCDVFLQGCDYINIFVCRKNLLFQKAVSVENLWL